MMRQNTVFNNAESYTHSELVETVESVPEKAAFAVREGEYIVPTLLPKEYTEVEEIVSKIDELDLAIVEEVARSKYLNSLQIYELVSLRGFSVQREHLRKRILKLMRYRVIRENIIKSPDAERGIRYYELDVKGYVIAKDRGVIFHIGNYYMSYQKRIELKKFDSPSEYSGLGVHAVRWLGNRLAIIQNTRNLTNIKPANAPQSGFGLDIGSISYEW